MLPAVSVVLGHLLQQMFYRACVATFVLLGRGDAREFGVDLVVLRDLEDGGAILDHPRQKVRSP